MPTLLSSTSMRPKVLRQAATIASTSRALAASAVNAVASPPSDVMISTVSWAALPLRSTQNTRAPSRAKVTAVALPLPQPGPIEPAPTTIAVLPLSRGIAFFPQLLLFARAHCRDVGANPKSKDLRQCLAMSIGAQPPFAGGTRVAERDFRHRRAF